MIVVAGRDFVGAACEKSVDGRVQLSDVLIGPIGLYPQHF
jgi:hypothetical protein